MQRSKFTKHLTRFHKSLPFLFIALALLITTYTQARWSISKAQQAKDSSPKAPTTDAEAEDPFNRINTLVLEDSKVVDSSVAELSLQEISKDTLSDELSMEKEKEAQSLAKERPQEKVHPLLSSQLEKLSDGGNQGEIKEVIITFSDTLRTPRFPSPDTAEARDSAYNQMAVSRATQMVEEVKAARAQDYQKLVPELSARYGATVVDTFWLINGVVAEMPLSAVDDLAAREDVLYVEPSYSGEKPPADSNNFNNVDDGRGRIDSDPYFNLGQTSGWIGLLDTGMRFSHTLFNSPSHVAYRRDCVLGGSNCNTMNPGFNPNDDCWNHGTSSGAIISGNGNLGFAFRGVTGITLDSFKVYPTGCGGLSATAAVNGFQAAVAALDRVIVAEMQGGGSDTSAISTAADNAFNAGAVIIAANGNNGSAASTVNTPANAHKVIGVGALDVQTLNQYSSQSRGPAPDGRIKPDIQAPTNSETAGSASDTSLKVFGGTSGATPYAAGGAALLRNWLRGSDFNIDPGQVYAHLILSGQEIFFNNTKGVGLINLPTNGTVWRGKVSVGNNGTIEIPLNIGFGNSRFDGALWWPETAAQAHNDVDLSLIDPSGVVRASSVSISSVFERARVGASIAPGVWKLRIRGYNVPTGSQTVYWAAHARP